MHYQIMACASLTQGHGLRELERDTVLLFGACEQKAFEREHFVAHVFVDLGIMLFLLLI